MVNYTDETIVLNGKIEKIKEVVIWYKTPFGYIDTMKEAVKIMTDAGLDPMMTIIPTVVYKGDTLIEPR
jgi:hypothetical protein